MRRLLWSSDAVRDREEIFDYIEARQPEAAVALDFDFSRKTARLREHPELGRPGRLPGTRELIAHRNFIIVYDLKDDAIRILRLLHAARKWPPDR